MTSRPCTTLVENGSVGVVDVMAPTQTYIWHTFNVRTSRTNSPTSNKWVGSFRFVHNSQTFIFFRFIQVRINKFISKIIWEQVSKKITVFFNTCFSQPWTLEVNCKIQHGIHFSLIRIAVLLCTTRVWH